MQPRSRFGPRRPSPGSWPGYQKAQASSYSPGGLLPAGQDQGPPSLIASAAQPITMRHFRRRRERREAQPRPESQDCCCDCSGRSCCGRRSARSSDCCSRNRPAPRSARPPSREDEVHVRPLARQIALRYAWRSRSLPSHPPSSLPTSSIMRATCSYCPNWSQPRSRLSRM